MKFKKDILVIDGIVDGSIESDDQTTVLFNTEETMFNSDAVTFKTVNLEDN